MNTPNDTYHKLDRAALWLLVGEFGGMALLVVLMTLIVIGNLISYNTFDISYTAREVLAVTVALVYGLAYLGNLAIGVWGFALYAIEKREGYPGTGHLVNWTLLSATIVMVLFLLAMIFSSI